MFHPTSLPSSLPDPDLDRKRTESISGRRVRENERRDDFSLLQVREKESGERIDIIRRIEKMDRGFFFTRTETKERIVFIKRSGERKQRLGLFLDREKTGSRFFKTEKQQEKKDLLGESTKRERGGFRM